MITISDVIRIGIITMIKVRGNGALLLSVATTSSNEVDWQINLIKQLSELGIKGYNNQINEFDIDSLSHLNNEYDITTKVSSLFGVLLPNLPSVGNITILSNYIEQFKTMAVLVIPDYSPDLGQYSDSKLIETKAFVKDVNRMRSYLKDQAKKCGAKVFTTIDKAIPEFLLMVTKWSNTVGSFGACGNTTWRKNILNPFLVGSNVEHYNPQCDHGTWEEWMIEVEENAKQNCNIIFLNLNIVPLEHTTTALVTMIEAVRFAQMSNRNVVIIYDPALDAVAADLIPNEVERCEFLFSRSVMHTIITNSSNPYLYHLLNFQDGIMTLYSMFRVQKSLNK
jgi:hypothetical protein